MEAEQARLPASHDLEWFPGRTLKAPDREGSAAGPVAAGLVMPGQILVCRLGPTAGSPGPRLLAGPGAKRLEDGSAVIAARPGRAYGSAGPVALAWVEPVVHLDDAGPADTHRWEGDVLVPGPLPSGRSVQCTGTLTVQGSVVGARVEAGLGAVIAGSCIRSAIHVGYPLSGTSALVDLVEGALAEWDGLEATLAAIQHRSPKPLPLHRAAQMLIDQHLPNLRLLLHAGETTLHPALPADALHHFAELERLVRAVGTGWATDAGRLRAEFEDHAATVLARLPRRASLWVRAAQDSELVANGDVHVDGTGALNSFVWAEGVVRVAGLVRGGRIEAAGVEAGEVSPGAQATVISIRPGGWFRARRVEGRVRVNIGDRAYEFSEAVHDVHLS